MPNEVQGNQFTSYWNSDEFFTMTCIIANFYPPSNYDHQTINSKEKGFGIHLEEIIYVVILGMLFSGTGNNSKGLLPVELG